MNNIYHRRNFPINLPKKNKQVELTAPDKFEYAKSVSR